MITKEDVILWFTRINNKCDRVTTGNYSHNVATVKSLCKRNIDFINEFGLEK